MSQTLVQQQQQQQQQQQRHQPAWQHFTVAVAQILGARQDVDWNVTLLDGAAADAAARGANLLLLPELYLQSYDIGVDAMHQSAVALDGPEFQRIKAIAKQHVIALCVPFAEKHHDQASDSGMTIRVSQ
jgi:predicted amidohydrolase